MTDNLLTINNLKVRYVSKERVVKAVNGISLVIKKETIVGLIGETGAGKTSTARAIMSLLPPHVSRIDEGSILYKDIDLLQAPAREMQQIRGAKIAMIFQDPMTSLNPVATIGDQISEAIALHQRLKKKEIRQRACEMLKLVGIDEGRFADYPHQFSGGMRQRVVIAMALACNPEIIIADEPTTALDVTIQAQVLDLILELQKKFGTSVLLITHDIGVVAQMSDYVAVMYAGEIVEYGTVRQIIKNAKHPYTKGLFSALPNLNEDVERLATIKGVMPDPSNLPAGCNFAPRCDFAFERCLKNNPAACEIEPEHLVKCFLFDDKDQGKGGDQ